MLACKQPSAQHVAQLSVTTIAHVPYGAYAMPAGSDVMSVYWLWLNALDDWADVTTSRSVIVGDNHKSDENNVSVELERG
jgi:hypothetical protein